MKQALRLGFKLAYDCRVKDKHCFLHRILHCCAKVQNFGNSEEFFCRRLCYLENFQTILFILPYFIFSGRYVARTIRFCACETEAVTLLRYKLWPSSPLRSNCAISTELLDFFIALQCEAHVSLNGFLNSLVWLDEHPSHEKVQLFL